MLRCSFIVLLALASVASDLWGVGCPFPPQHHCGDAPICPNTSECIVTTECEFVHALCWKAEGCGCDVIKVEAQTTLLVYEGISIGSGHSSSENPLHIIIQGEMNWAGEPAPAQGSMGKMFAISGASNLTIDGGGILTSDYTPCQEWSGEPPMCDIPEEDGVLWIGKAFSGEGGSNITIQDLSISNFASAIEMVASEGSPMSNLMLKNLTLQSLQGYGVFLQYANGITIDNCDVLNAYGEHGFRIREADNVSIVDSTANNVSKTGFWWMTGSGLTVNGFVSTGQRTRVGPNHDETGAGVENQRALNADVRNVEIVGGEINDKMEVNLGTIGAWFDDIDNDLSETIALGPIGTERPLNKVYWGTLNNGSGTGNLGTHACVGPDKGHRGCKYDVVVNDSVDVDDLLAIINAWGACPQITLCTSPQFTDYQCPAMWRPTTAAAAWMSMTCSPSSPTGDLAQVRPEADSRPA